MNFRTIGCSHHTAPVEVRERIAFTPGQIEQALNQIRNRYPKSEAVLLNTCNRVELYIASSEDVPLPSTQELVSFVLDFHNLKLDNVDRQFHRLESSAAVEHLFSVACSLDSLVVGESQISSQVHNAYAAACEAGFAGSAMHAIFQHANLVAKRVTNETDIHRRRISVPSVAVSEIASEFFERFDDKEIVVIGSGEMGVETLQYLQSAGASANRVHIVNRSLERAQSVAQQFGVRVAEWEQLDSLMLDADLIVSTTGATQPIVTENRFKALLPNRKKGTLLILDLAVPRDFEAGIGKLPSIYLYSIDDLRNVCDRNKSLRQQQLPKAQRIIQEEAQRFLADWNYRSSSDTIRALREQADAIRTAELTRLFGKQAMQQRTPEMEQEISQALDRVVNKILHSPMQSLRDVTHTEQRDSLVSALRRLFQIR